MQISSYKNYPSSPSVNFGALQLAHYGHFISKENVKIYQLERSDIGYLEHLINNLDKFYKKYDIDNLTARQVIEEAFNAGIAILKSDNEKKARILMSFYNNEPSSILIGNVLKVDQNGNYHYSSRKNHAKDETALDWLAAWNKKFRGKGQATVYEYFLTLIKDGFKQCFVRSEIPGKSSAVDFYTRVGFEALSDTPRRILRQNDNIYEIGKYDDKTDTIIPMIIKKPAIKTFLRKNAKSVMREEIQIPISLPLPKENFDGIA